MSRVLAILIGVVCCGLAACGSYQRSAASLDPAASPSPSVVAWLPLTVSNRWIDPPPAPLVPPVEIPPGTPACTAAELELGHGFGGGGAGHTIQRIILRNRGSLPCVLEGYPDIAIIGVDGQVLAQGAGTTGRGTFVPVVPPVPVLL
jgi:hypothetical protein